jgi:hypothetical protein
MARRDKNQPHDPVPPPAPTAPADEKIGGASGLDEAMRPVVSSVLSSVLDGILDTKPFTEALRYLSPSVRQISSLLPMGVGYGFAKLPVSLFPNPTIAHFAQDVVVEMARHLDRKIKAVGSVDKMSEDDYAKALHEGAKVATEKKYAVDPMGHIHRSDCVKLGAFRRPHQERRDRDGKPIPPPPSQLQEVTLETAVAQKLQVSPCCFEGVNADLKKAAEPKTEKKPRSPMDVIGGSGDPELQKQFNDWFKSLTVAERERVTKLLRHLDSVDEFKGLMATDPEIRDEMLTLLENTNASYTVGKVLEAIGKASKTAGTEIIEAAKVAYREFKSWEASLAPTEARLEAKLKEPAKRRPWHHMFRVW